MKKYFFAATVLLLAVVFVSGCVQVKSPNASSGITECAQNTNTGEWCYTSEGNTACSNSRDSCIAMRVGDTLNPADCDQISDQTQKDGCYSNLAYGTKNVNYCNNISDSKDKSDCIGRIAGELKDFSMCNTSQDKDICYYEYAYGAKDPSKCGLIQDQDTRDACNAVAAGIPSPP